MRLGARVGETVAHVELGRMPTTLAVTVEGVEREMADLSGDWEKIDRRICKQFVDHLLSRDARQVRLTHQPENALIKSEWRCVTTRRILDGGADTVRVSLTEQNGKQSRRVDEDQSPESSSKNALSALRDCLESRVGGIPLAVGM